MEGVGFALTRLDSTLVAALRVLLPHVALEVGDHRAPSRQAAIERLVRAAGVDVDVHLAPVVLPVGADVCPDVALLAIPLQYLRVDVLERAHRPAGRVLERAAASTRALIH